MLKMRRPCCADLLRTYKNHIAPDFVDRVVGSDALIIPSANVEDLTDFRQLRLGFRRNSFGDGTGIVPEP
jgi:hypothetical protein